MVWRKSRAGLGHSSISLQKAKYRKTPNPPTWQNSSSLCSPITVKYKVSQAGCVGKPPFHLLPSIPIQPPALILEIHYSPGEAQVLLSDKAAQPALCLSSTYSILGFLYYLFLISGKEKSLHNHIRWKWSTPLWHFLDFALLTSTCFCTPVPQQLWNLSGNSPVVVHLHQLCYWQHPIHGATFSFNSPWDTPDQKTSPRMGLNEFYFRQPTW